MLISIELTEKPIPASATEAPPTVGSIVEFRGVVRASENGAPISALRYEAYGPMAVSVMRQILESLAEEHPCHSVQVVHRHGVVPVGETAVAVTVCSAHRGEGFALLAKFMDRLKQDVPIWKVEALA